VRPVDASEIVDLATYARLRPEYRRRVIEYKRNRRIAVGERVSLLFEDRETLRFQVQEMLLVERISDPEKVQHELDIYNELVPGKGELSATLFIEVGDLGEIRAELDRLVGIDEHLLLVLGDGASTAAVRADFDPRQLESDRISAVQYVRFALPAEALARFCDPSLRARIRVDHPAYQQEVELPRALRASLVATLTGEPEPLLRSEPNAPRAPDEIELETPRVRVLRVGDSPERWIVEPFPPCSLLAAEPDLLAELAATLQQAVARLAERHGAVRIEAPKVARDLPLRWHLTATPR
jgi:hypothetical protein